MAAKKIDCPAAPVGIGILSFADTKKSTGAPGRGDRWIS
jgi:hypothetical protein